MFIANINSFISKEYTDFLTSGKNRNYIKLLQYIEIFTFCLVA